MWKSHTWASEARQKLIEKLEAEYLKDPSELFGAHILRLKKAWGMVRALPMAAA
jgi:hypothetical protein